MIAHRQRSASNCRQHQGHVATMPRRQGFTLFEIVISLAILAVGVVTVMALIPVGLKAQQHARFAAFASAKALDLLETFNCQVFNNLGSGWNQTRMSLEVEGANPWDTSIGSRALVSDLESKLSTIRGGLLPLPVTIAGRLDSDGDEIANLLSAGGRLYYPNPMPTNDEGGSYNWAWNPDQRSLYGTSETRRLLVGIVGPAQANKVPVNPFKAWPYYHGYPSPPVAFEQREDADAKRLYDQGYWAYHRWDDAPRIGDYSFEENVTDRPIRERCERYVRLAFWYARRHQDPAGQRLPDAFIAGNAQDSDVEAAFANADHVRTQRYLAHAVTCLTKWYTADQLTATVTLLDQDILDDNGAVVVPASDPDNREISITLDGIKNCHQRSLDLVMKHAASFPYSWGPLRPINRAIMTDVPLLEWDLFPASGTPLLSGSIEELGAGGGTNVPATHYRLLAPMAISNRGVATVNATLSASDQGSRIDFPASPVGQTAAFNAVFGDIKHFTLTKPFTPDERCREVVFWMADWQAYEDCETTPSAPVDASKFPIRDPRVGTFDKRMMGFLFNPVEQASYFNPERNLLHAQDVSLLPAGANTTDLQINHFYPLPDDRDNATTPAGLSMFSGLYGADRNQNGVLDRGPLVQSVRMRATTIARFVVYDPRLPLTLR